MDEVLLVASSRSFGAVNREQFYVSISRGREGVHVFTDDAELLARRVTDSHERKAAIELQALRDDLAKLGFRPRQQPKEESVSPVAMNLRAVRSADARQRRQICATRLSPLQHLPNLVEGVRRRAGEWLGIEPKETVKQSETAKESRTVKEAIQERETARRKLNRGISRVSSDRTQASRFPFESIDRVYTLEPNPEAGDDKNAPPQKLVLAFSTADVVILGWSLGTLADKLRENDLATVQVLPNKYGELARSKTFVAFIKITTIGKNETPPNENRL